MIAVVGHTSVETTVPDGLLADADAFGEHVLSTSVSGVGVRRRCQRGVGAARGGP
ncbi:hypothetical protein [Actinopolymorpha singaporensis]|uniref:Uncharacterized protein n=1 Tax=Actinopolymorpha singaporensis TaxID=117157 RepID=A0A1H1VF95_9ACTN|nr:hypothetical protein [Actinopolymorpha singaporensis]SDS83452.1 hypothetical protein SAMN04489717_4043 [Actinopolymorpha singaporensis]